MYIFQKMQEPKQPDPLIEASQLFRKENHELSKAKLQTIKHTNENIDLNLLLTEHKINPGNSDIVLKALMDKLTQINIKLFKDMGLMIKQNKSSKNPIKHIKHEFFYWNIIVIAQQIGKPSIASLIGYEALEYSSCFRTKTALMIIYEVLKQMACENRLASCGTLVMKFKEIFQRAKKLTNEQEIYRSMNHIMWTKILLRLGFLEESAQMYKSKLGKTEEQLYESSQTVLPFEIYRQFLHAQIEYFKENYKGALQVLGQILNSLDKTEKLDKFTKQKISSMVQSNVASILMIMNKPSIGRRMLSKSNEHFRKICHEGIDNERYLLYERSKQLLMYSFLKNPESLTKDDYSKALHLMTRTETNKSYKLFYRKGQLCLQHLHNLVEEQQDTLPYKEIVDNYECCYNYINDPYFQSKGKNRNPGYQQGKRYYRRYIVEEWDDNADKRRDMDKPQEVLALQSKVNQPAEPEMNGLINKSQEIIEEKPEKKKRKASNIVNQEATKDKKNLKDFLDEQNDPKKRIKSEPKDKENEQKNPFSRKDRYISQIAFKAITYFKQSLALLQEEKKVVLTFPTSDQETNLTEQVNLKIYEDYRVFKQSILMCLCYLYLLRQNWMKVIQHTDMYRKFVAYDKESNSYETKNIKKAYNQQEYFCVLSYEMEAYCQMNKLNRSYQTMQDIIQLGYSEGVTFSSCSSINLNPKHAFIEETNQYHNLLYNITVLHMRDNHLPEAHQALQKILTETNILPNRSSFKTPLSANDLLLHYHLRTGDRISALEILKRRRVMGMGGVNGVYNVMKVTK